MKEKMIDMQKVSKENIKIIGAELKRRRINQSKTLVNLSSVCSISYISKIENGKIVPKLHVLRELCDEHGITMEELETLLNVDKIINECIEALFWNNRQKIDDLYTQVYQFNNYKVSFIKIIYEITYLHWDNVKHLLDSLYIIKNNMEEDDLFLFIYLSMRYCNAILNYPKVYELHNQIRNCKNVILMALASKEMFIAVAKYGLECPINAYEEYNRRYTSLFNYSSEYMYELLMESLIRGNYDIPENIQKAFDSSMKLKYYLVSNKTNEITELLKVYKPSKFEKLLIATLNKEYADGEKIYNKLQLYKLPATEVIIANYCNYINKGLDEELAVFIIQTASVYAKNINDGALYKMFLKKLSEIAFVVGKYKAVASMNLTFFEMMEKCKKCLL